MFTRRLAQLMSPACALLVGASLILGCGGVNLGDKDRRVRAGATGDAGSEDDVELEPVEAGTAPVADPVPAVPPPDAGPPDAAPIVPAGSFAAGRELETTANVNLRNGPGTEFAIIVEVPIATRVKVEKTSGADGWVNIAYDGKIGFSSKDFLEPVP